MIHYLVTEAGNHTFRGNPILDDPRLRDRFRVVTYTEAFETTRWRGGTVIFSDVDRLAPFEAMRASVLHQRLGQAGRLRLLNHPTRTCRRYQMLRRLRLAGINRHDIFRVDELRKPRRYPVFVRSESQHDGSFTELIHDERSLFREIERLIRQGMLPQELLVVEFEDTADEDGIYRKATGYIVGDWFFQRYLFFGDHWQVKQPRTGNVATRRAEAALLAEEEAYSGGEEHLLMMREVARIGAIGFGRIDFGIGKDGRTEIWEVNTNPDPAVLTFSVQGARADKIVPRGWQMQRDALAALDDDEAHEIEMDVEPPPRGQDWYAFIRHQARERAGLPPTH